MLKLDSLLYAIEVAKVNSINKASETLYLSQPYLSCCLKELEKELGIKLFHRSYRGTELTDAGKQFLEYAYEIEHSLKKMYQLKEKQVDPVTLRIMSMHSFTFLDIFTDFECQYKTDETLSYVELPNGQIPLSVSKKEADVGLCYISQEDKQKAIQEMESMGLRFTPLLEEPLYVIVGRLHPLAKKKSVRMSELEGYPFVLDNGKMPQHGIPGYSDKLRQRFCQYPISFDNSRSQMYFLTRSENCFSVGQKCMNLTNPMVQSGTLLYLPIEDQVDEPLLVGYVEREGKSTQIQRKFTDFVEKSFENYPDGLRDISRPAAVEEK